MRPVTVKSSSYYAPSGRKKLHNDLGPSLEYDNGQMEWWWRGCWCVDMEEYMWYSEMSEENKVMLILKYGKNIISAEYSHYVHTVTSSTGPRP